MSARGDAQEEQASMAAALAFDDAKRRVEEGEWTAEARAVLQRLSKIGANKPADRIARRHGVSLAKVLGRHRIPSAASRARHELWSVLWGTFDLSWPKLAAIVERDHSTVMHGVKKRMAKLEAAIARAVPRASEGTSP